MKILWIYLAVINMATFITFCIDKLRAVKHRFRISEFTLLLMSFIGGAAGGLLAMYAVRHKTQKKSFTVSLSLMLLVHIALIVYLIVSFH